MIHEFGPFRYDASQRLLFRGTELVPLVPKAVDILHVLLERRGTVVEKAELMRLVWPDTAVEEVGLARNISLLRKALGDGASEYEWIETIPRRGYRFISAPMPASTGIDPPGPADSHRRTRIALAAVALLIAAAVYYQFFVPSRYVPEGQFARLATVPFECLCPDIDGASFSQGLDEVLVSGLASIDGVQVISPATVRRYRRFGISMSLMARLLGVDILVEGTVQKLDERLRMTVRMADVHTGRVIWSDSRDESAADPARAQAEIARILAAEASRRLASPTR